MWQLKQGENDSDSFVFVNRVRVVCGFCWCFILLLICENVDGVEKDDDEAHMRWFVILTLE